MEASKCIGLLPNTAKTNYVHGKHDKIIIKLSGMAHLHKHDTVRLMSMAVILETILKLRLL